MAHFYCIVALHVYEHLLNKTFQVGDMFYNPVCRAASCRPTNLVVAQP